MVLSLNPSRKDISFSFRKCLFSSVPFPLSLCFFSAGERFHLSIRHAMIGASQLSLLAVNKVGFANEPRSWGVAVIAVIAVQVRRRKCGAVVRLQGKGTQSCLHERQGAHLVLGLEMGHVSIFEKFGEKILFSLAGERREQGEHRESRESREQWPL